MRIDGLSRDILGAEDVALEAFIRSAITYLRDYTGYRISSTVLMKACTSSNVV